MDHPCALMPTMRRAIVIVATAMLVWGEVSTAMAQQFTPSPARTPAKKPSPSPAAPPVTGQPQGAEGLARQFMFSPWTTICGKDGPEGSNAREVCAVMTEARVPSGQIAVAVSLVDPKEGQKILRVTMPLGVRLPFGTRVILDQGAPLQSAYLMCLAGCISDYELKADMVDKLKKGHTLTVQAINPGGYRISIDVPLMEFAKAYDGLATDEKVMIERERKLQVELQHRAEEARNKLEGQSAPAQGPQAAPSQPPQGAQSADPFTAPGGK